MFKTKKLIIAGGVLITVIMLFGINSSAEETPTVKINGTTMEFDVEPLAEKGTILVPIRAISEKLGYEVIWYSESKKVEIKNEKNVIEFMIDKAEYTHNGKINEMDVQSKIMKDRTLIPLMVIAEVFDCEVQWLPEENIAEIIKYEVIEVDSPEALLNAVGSYKRIVLEEGEYNLTQAKEICTSSVRAEETYDGKEYVVYDVNNLIIEGAEGKTVTVVTEPRYSYVLRLLECDGVTVKNITAGHTIEPGYCIGGVLMFEESKNCKVDNCRLYGCGTYGISAYNSENITINKTEIYECTYGLTEIVDSKNVSFDECLFRDSEEFSMFYILRSSKIEINNSQIMNNLSTSEFMPFICATESDDVIFNDCDFKDNKYEIFAEGNIKFEDCMGVEK